MIMDADIPGMNISRIDLKHIVYERFMELSEQESDERASALTDEELEDIAYAFSVEFFEVNEGLFAKLLWEAFQSWENYDKKKDGIL